MTLSAIIVYLAIWTVLLTFPGTIALMMAGGLKIGFYNRDDVPELPAWGGRALRAHRNMIENLPVFLALVLAAQIAQAPQVPVLLGATIFLWARIAHGVLYIAGVPYLRTVAFVVSIGGLVRIAAAVLGV
ncbi:MAG TPA: MAPEG family protein [Candidatus Limnocylindrales bacterium]|nr:MAPEG family protein [Candidatus Limnocylindrales bacterium]